MSLDLPPIPKWLEEYAAFFCRDLVLPPKAQLKGPGHALRIELDWEQRYNGITKHLPVFTIQRLKPGCAPVKRGDPCYAEQFTTVRCALATHYLALENAMLGVGYELERNQIINRKAFAFSAAWWAMNREPIPSEIHVAHTKATLTLIKRRDTREERRIVKNTAS